MTRLKNNKIIGSIYFIIAFLFLLQEVALSQSIPFETIDKGESSYFNYGDPNFLGADIVVRDRETWNWFWGRHDPSNLLLIPSSPPPQINFSKEMVLATMLGYQTSGGGPSIEISSVEEISGTGVTNRGMIATVKENREPGLLTVVTNPYHIVKIKNNFSIIFHHQPIDKPCSNNSECGGNEYCEKAVGDCNGMGRCKLKSEVCIDLFDPVCGCDGNTYSNGCVASAAGVSLLYRGECGTECMKNEECGLNEFCRFPEGICVGPGTCTPKPNYCYWCYAQGSWCYAPVCGCDGKTYANDCEAYINGISILHIGECQFEQKCILSGGVVSTAMCCNAVGDFPNTCMIGACSCAPIDSHQVKICDCGVNKCFDGNQCISF